MKTILLLQKCLKKKWIVHWNERWRDNLLKQDQICVAMQLSIVLLQNIKVLKGSYGIFIFFEDMGLLIVKNHLPM
jgi:hypothetical protein